ncbi:39704_t:CDS:2 [Gigaspora margarita]|uniref:39704_t:CDS:1 n=1 Tax=Gigaspora margarita TaxID=4874 RepID=A0ABN7V760_GIGMA|nr:39704_t:CDS:2 [Gigaspora margarita]
MLKRPETPFDILHNTNTSARKRCRNRTLPPTYEVPSILITRGRNEDVSEIVTTSNNRDNGNNVNDVSGDSGRNTNSVCGDLDNATYSSSSELANITSKLNTSILRSDSDLSMPDIGSSQPPSCMENINEEN